MSAPLDLSPMDLRLLGVLYSRRRGVTAAFAAKLSGLSVEEAKAELDRLVRMGLAVKRGKFYSRPYDRLGRLRRVDRGFMGRLLGFKVPVESFKA